MKKLIEIEFKDDFTPPDWFDCSTLWSKCDPCPFYVWEDDAGTGYCRLLDPSSEKCPIKKYF